MALAADTTGIAESLMIEEIPVKLRCAACDKLAVNAFRMPCCEQSICEECQESLPQACPVCLHEPVCKDDCRPNKALRTTIKVFLKKKGVEREGARKKDLLAQAASTPSAPVTPTIDNSPRRQQSQILVDQASEPPNDATDVRQEARGISRSGKIPSDFDMDIPQKSIESPGSQDVQRQVPAQTTGEGSFVPHAGDEDQRAKHQDHGKVQNLQRSQDNRTNPVENGFGFDMNATFPNMANIGMGDFNPMMQFMPNGMPNNMAGQFPNMMGQFGMGMDPMAMSQGIYSSFGGPGMGINGMNMGMGFDAGQNAYGSLNGQPQVFNQSQYNGHTNGIGGSYGPNAGFGGNNMPQHQGSFNQMHQHQNYNNDFQHGYHNHGFYNRGRGRGRGGSFYAGRGSNYSHQAFQGRQATNDQTPQSQLPEQVQRRGSPVYTPMQGSGSEPSLQQKVDTEILSKKDDQNTRRTDDAQINKELEPGDADGDVENPKSPVREANVETNKETVDIDKSSREQQAKADQNLMEGSKLDPIQSVASDEIVDTAVNQGPSRITAHTTMPPPTCPSIPTGPSKSMSGMSIPPASSRGRGFGRGFVRGFPEFRPATRGRGSVTLSNISAHAHSTSSTEQSLQAPPAPKGLGVEGAPTGPKAFRQGASNVSSKSSQDAGFSIVGRAGAQVRPNGIGKSPSEKAADSRSRSRSPSRSESRSYSPVHPNSSSHRHHLKHSVSPSREGKRDKKRDRYERSSRKDDDYYEVSRDVKGSRTREASSHSSHRHSTHRSHRDYDKGSSRSKHRSHRSHRDRTISPERDSRVSRKRSKSPELRISGASRRHADESRYKDRDDEGRASRKRRERDDEERDCDRKRSRRGDDYVADGQEKSHRSKQSQGEEHDSHKESKAREGPVEIPVEPPKGPKVDQHALEREARNRERQMKEIQRRALMEGKPSGSRGKANGRVVERRASYKYEDEDLTSRVEKERESNRWG